MINTPNLNEARKQIMKAKHPVIVKAQDDAFNRKILEYGKFDILLSVEPVEKNSLRKVNSGLNHVLAKIAAKNNIAIGIDIKILSTLEKKQKADTLSKIIQNIKIARKARTKIKVLNYTDKRNAQAVLISLGASTQQAKDAVQ